MPATNDDRLFVPRTERARLRKSLLGGASREHMNLVRRIRALQIVVDFFLMDWGLNVMCTRWCVSTQPRAFVPPMRVNIRLTRTSLSDGERCTWFRTAEPEPLRARLATFFGPLLCQPPVVRKTLEIVATSPELPEPVGVALRMPHILDNICEQL